MLKAGLTGNIGSGKTTVARIFKTLGAAVFNADEQAKKVLNKPKYQAALVRHFGKQILASDHSIDRKQFSQIIFSDPEALNFVSSMIHPIVRQRFADFCDKHAKSPFCIYEAAVLIETNFFKQLDKIILVSAPEELRIQRVLARDNIDAESLRQRMKNQWAEGRKKNYADFVIVNDEKSPVLEQCLEIYNKLTIAG